MAYAVTSTTTSLGKGRYIITIQETDCGTADEAVISNVPAAGRLLKQVTHLASGTGTTVDPIIGFVTNPSGLSILAENDTPASAVNNISSPPNPFNCSTGVLYHRSRPDAGSDNVINTRYLLLADWE